MTVTSLKLTRRSNLFRQSKKNKSGTSYELKNIANNIQWTTDLNFSAGELTFDLIQKSTPIVPYTGDIISFKWDKKKVFYGFVFKYSIKKNNIVSVTCYDPLRYLKNEDSVVFKAGTVAERFKEVCKRAGLNGKVISAPSHKCKAELFDGKTYFDMIKSGIDSTSTATGKKYFVLANYNKVELRKVPYKTLKIYIGSNSGMTDFNYAVDIDRTYNIIKVVKANDKKKNMSISKSAKAQGKSVQQWGKLQKIIKPKDKANEAQMLKQAKDELKIRNVANKTLTIDCIGNLNFIPGNAVTIKISDIKKTIKNCPIIKAIHKFDNQKYTCSLTMKAGRSWQESGSTS